MAKKQEERPEYYATSARAMNCVPANFDHGEGEPCVVLTVGAGSNIEQMSFPIADAKFIAAKMLVALATYDNEFARKLLDDHFAADKDGEFIWPRES